MSPELVVRARELRLVGERVVREDWERGYCLLRVLLEFLWDSRRRTRRQGRRPGGESVLRSTRNETDWIEKVIRLWCA